MKNKLLVTTAVGALAITGLAQAETKITGSLDISYGLQTQKNTVLNSKEGWGRESQLNISNSGDLSNGMKYAAGFSLEFDGSGNASDIADENLYIDFISGKTTLSIGQDHGLNTDSSAIPRVSVPANSVVGGKLIAQQGAKVGKADSTGHVKEGMGVFVAQGFDGATAQIRYTPQFSNDGGANDGIGTSPEGAAYDVNVQGDFGVKNLSVNLQYAKAEKALGSTHTSNRDSVGKHLSVGYNFGKVAVGIGKTKREIGTSATADYSQMEYAATFAINDQLSVGVDYMKSDANVSGAADEKVTSYQVGYNLGAVGIQAGYIDVKNLGATATSNDNEFGFVRFTTKF